MFFCIGSISSFPSAVQEAIIIHLLGAHRVTSFGILRLCQSGRIPKSTGLRKIIEYISGMGASVTCEMAAEI